jgi:hypothetical protein
MRHLFLLLFAACLPFLIACADRSNDGPEVMLVEGVFVPKPKGMTGFESSGKVSQLLVGEDSRLLVIQTSHPVDAATAWTKAADRIRMIGSRGETRLGQAVMLETGSSSTLPLGQVNFVEERLLAYIDSRTSETIKDGIAYYNLYFPERRLVILCTGNEENIGTARETMSRIRFEDPATTASVKISVE